TAGGGRGPRREERHGEGTWIAGRRAVVEAIRAGLAREVLVAGDVAGDDRGGGADRTLLEACAEAGIAPREVLRAELDRIAPHHQGVAARVSPPRPLSDHDLRRF